jgi:hypothetical protein
MDALAFDAPMVSQRAAPDAILPRREEIAGVAASLEKGMSQ